MYIYKVVLTGGPRSGKTSLIKELRKEYSKRDDIVLITVPETASLLRNNGITSDVMQSTYDFQNLLFKVQYFKEKQAESVAQRISEKKDVVIVYDRGLLDNKAYLNSQEEFDSILKSHACKELEILDKYDLIIDLISTAGSEYGYETGTNEARFEDEGEAIKTDIKTTEAWLGHKNIKIVKPSETFEEKYAKVSNLIDILVKSNRSFFVEKRINPIDSINLSDFKDGKTKRITTMEYDLDYKMPTLGRYRIYERTYKGCVSYLLQTYRNFDIVKRIDSIKSIDEATANAFIEQFGIETMRKKDEIYYYRDGEIRRVNIYDDSINETVEYDSSFESKEKEITDSNKVLQKRFDNRHIIC